jgi:single-stranded DNA-binding protein
MNGAPIQPWLVRPVKDAVLRYSEKGRANANVHVANSYRYPKRDAEGNPVMKDGKRVFDEKTTYIDAIGWGQLAERLGEKAKRGTELLVEGRIQTRQYIAKDKEGNPILRENGKPVKRNVQELILSHFRVIPKQGPIVDSSPAMDEDLPEDEGSDEPA